MGLSPILKKLLFVRQFSIDEGKIKLLGDPEIMLHASAVVELQEIDQSKLYDVAKKSSLRNIVSFVEHAKVYEKVKDVFISDIAGLGKKIGQTDSGVISVLQEIFNVYGLGDMAIEKIDNSKKQAIVVIRESTIADEWLKKNKKHSKNPVCTLTAGIIAGMFSYIFDKEIDCVEAKCRGQTGGGYCLFRVG
jgi:hypothetical protein